MLAFLSALVDPVVAIQLTDPFVTYGLVALFLLLATLIVIRICVSKARKKRRAQESAVESAVHEVTLAPEGSIEQDEQSETELPAAPVPEEPKEKPRLPAMPLPTLSFDEPVRVSLRPSDVQEHDGTLYVSFDIDVSADETHFL